jgi:hypothetical protein
MSANVHRRHLTAKQKDEVIEKLLKARPEMSDRQIASIAKRDHKTVSKKRAKMKSRGEIPHVEKRTDTKGRKQPSAKPKKSPKQTSPVKIKPVSAKQNVTLENFIAPAMELVRITRNRDAECFAKTALPDENIRHLARFFTDLAKIRRLTGEPAEVSAEQRKAEHAALDKAVS